MMMVLDINKCSEIFGDNCTENLNCTNTEDFISVASSEAIDGLFAIRCVAVY